MQKGCFAVFKIKVTVKALMIKMRLSATSAELLILLQPNFGLMAHHPKLGCCVERKKCICMFYPRSSHSKGSKFL